MKYREPDDLESDVKRERAYVLIEALNIPRDRNVPGRFVTSWGTKTPLELYGVVKRIVEGEL